ncbi:TonB-dependent siderophore receptor [Barnesiella sp. CU968]|jgi:vitamin B12 transporter|uniref:TonB-dependent receptor plug domain-containing protein n=1 Tax=Barnesiella sp. CU968 TaxID=2780099 RepID=UPI00195B29BF|nr:TonB-dependent receptor plug domain-containing protein [Barnesiella sp. CU968]MBJ2198783.1 TonB-dependent receptor [Muribaculaceae bacterium]MCI9029238.1 TonB-dependent receptor [Muribaculaceae bacterium]
MKGIIESKKSLKKAVVMVFAEVLGCIPAFGVSVPERGDAYEAADTAGRSLQEFEVVSERVRREVTSTAPLFNLTSERMKTMGVTDISDALHRLPGINIRDYGGAGGMKTVSVRGFGTTHTGVIYDGIVLSDCQSGKIDLSRYSLDNVGSLSLIVGDNSDIFVPAKASASAASIIISSMSVPGPMDSLWHVTGQMRFGSFGTYNPYFKVGKSLTPKFSFSVIGEYTHAKNDYPFTLENGKLVTRERRNNSMMNSWHGEINTRWRLTPASMLDAKVYYYDNNRQLPGPVILYNPICHEKLRDRNFFGQLTYKNLSLSKFSFQGLAKFNWDASLYHDEDGKYPGGILDEDYFQREVYVSGSALYVPTDKLAFNYSADYFYNNLTTNQMEVVGPWRHSVLQSFTGKFQNSWLLATARLLWSIYDNGVKEGISSKDENKLSPSLSVSVQPMRNRLFFIRASYKNIFRMPTFNETYYFRMGSTSLKPEDTDQFNLGLTWQYNSTNWLNALVLTGDVYYNNVKDKIVALPMNMFIWTMTNMDKARAFGADVTASATFNIARGQNLVFAGNYSWQRVQPRTSPKDPDYNKQVAYTPIHSGAASLSWENPWVDVVVHTTGASDRYGTNSNLPITRIKGYMEMGAALIRSFKIKRNTIDLRFDMTNILDTQYEIVGNYPMPGRAWKFTLTYKYN